LKWSLGGPLSKLCVTPPFSINFRCQIENQMRDYRLPGASSLYARLETGRIIWLGMAGERPHRFPHNNFSSVYRIFNKLGHMIPLWKGKNPIYFGVIRSKVKVTITINRIRCFCTITSSVYWIFTKLGHMIPLWKGKNLIYFGVIRSKVKVTVTVNIIFDNGRFRTITLVLYIGSLTNLATWFPVEGEEPYLFWGHYHYTVW
jgi:hypothetical protein